MSNDAEHNESDIGALQRAGCIFFAIIPLVVFSLSLFGYLLSYAKVRHIAEHNIDSICTKGWFGSVNCKYPEITIADLNDGSYYGSVVLPVTIFAILYPFTGRSLFEISNSINNLMLNVLDIKQRDMFVDQKMLICSLWPILIILIPLQILALLFSTAYKMALW